MPAPKERKTGIINVQVLKSYKDYLDKIIVNEGYATVAEAVMGIFDEHKDMRKRIKLLEKQIEDAGLTPVANDSVGAVDKE